MVIEAHVIFKLFNNSKITAFFAKSLNIPSVLFHLQFLRVFIRKIVEKSDFTTNGPKMTKTGR